MHSADFDGKGGGNITIEKECVSVHADSRSFRCARQEQQLSGERPQRARQQEALAEGKGVHREVESEGSRMSAEKNAGGQTPEPTNRNHIEGRTETDECARQHEVQCCPNPVR